MYKYFMGKRSNLANKKEEDPIVISTSDEAREKINNWLDKYEIDLDNLIEPVTHILESELSFIGINDENEIFLKLENNTDATLFLMDEEIPKCEVNIGNLEYTLVVSEEYYVESFAESVGEVKMGVNFELNAVLMGKDNVYIMTKFEQFDFSIYETMKKNINKLNIWDNIAHNMIWYKELPLTIPTYDLAITYVDERGFFITRIVVIHDRIFSYLQSNNSGEYEVESDGSWIAEHDIYTYKYNPWEKKCIVGVPQDTLIPAIHYYTCLSYVFDYTKTMLQTILVINSTFEKVDKLRKTE